MDPRCGPGMKSGWTGVGGLGEIFRALFVLIGIGAGRERESVLRREHTKLLSGACLESAGIRPKEDSLFGNSVKVGTALSADWRRPSRSGIRIGVGRGGRQIGGNVCDGSGLRPRGGQGVRACIFFRASKN